MLYKRCGVSDFETGKNWQRVMITGFSILLVCFVRLADWKVSLRKAQNT
jgi:hypothetical protein